MPLAPQIALAFQAVAATIKRLRLDRMVEDRLEFTPNPSGISGPVGARLTIPTHMTPAGGQTTHPAVVFIPGGWNGYEYWMAHTPYPGSSDAHEDPNIACSLDGITWIQAPGAPAPLDDAPGGTNYNSDTDLALGPDGALYVFWRNYQSGATGVEEKIYYRKSANGSTWTAKALVYQSNQATRRLVSPSFILEDGAWTMYAVDIVPTPNAVVRLRSTNEDPASAWSAPTAVSVGAMQATKEPWHLKIIKHNGRYSGLLNDTDNTGNGFNGDLLFITSTNGTTFTNSGGPVIPRAYALEHDQLYRATLIPAVQNGVYGFRVWYSAKLSTTWNIYRTFIAEATPVGAFRECVGFGATGVTLQPATGVNIAVTFPVGRFTAPPAVFPNADSSRLTLSANGITKDGCNIRADNWSPGAAGTAIFNWHAIQMTPNSSAG